MENSKKVYWIKTFLAYFVLEHYRTPSGAPRVWPRRAESCRDKTGQLSEFTITIREFTIAGEGREQRAQPVQLPNFGKRSRYYYINILIEDLRYNTRTNLLRILL